MNETSATSGQPRPKYPPVWPAPRRRSTRILAPVAVLAFLAAATAYVLMFNPTDNKTDLSGPCVFHLLFGINGPFCGGTRMYWYLIHGDLVEAFRHHPVALIGIPFAVYGLTWWTVRSWTGKRLPAFVVTPRMYFGYAIVWMVFGLVLRNLPAGPFTWFNIPYLG